MAYKVQEIIHNKSLDLKSKIFLIKSTIFDHIQISKKLILEVLLRKSICKVLFLSKVTSFNF